MTVPYEASLIAQLLKNLPAMQETPIRFLVWEDPPTLAWKIPWTEEPGGLHSMESRLRDFTFTHCRRTNAIIQDLSALLRLHTYALLEMMTAILKDVPLYLILV